MTLPNLQVGKAFEDATHAAGQSVAVGSGGAIYTSTDGLNWVLRRSNLIKHLRGVTYGGGMFVAVGEGGAIVTSLDGVAWNVLDGGTDANRELWAVHHDGTRFFAVGSQVPSGALVLSSTDGENWADVSPAGGVPETLFGIAYNGSRYVAVGDGGVILHSQGGVAWNSLYWPGISAFYDVMHDGSRFHAVGKNTTGNGILRSSNDGATWEYRNIGAVAPLNKVIRAGSGYLALGNTGTVITSPDGGDVWTKRSSQCEGSLRAAVVTGSRITVASSWGAMLVSSDGIDWTTISHALPAPPVVSCAGIAAGIETYVDGRYFSVRGGDVYSSTDAMTWEHISTLGANLPVAMAYGNGRFVAVGDGIISSTAGVNWTAGYDTGVQLESVAFGGGMFVAVGRNGTIVTSGDGLSWTARNSGSTSSLGAVAYGGAQWVVLGGVGELLTSADGMTWTQRDSGTSASLNDVVYDDTRWLAVGFSGTIVSSLDGINWAEQRIGDGENLKGIAYDGARRVVVGNSGTIFDSLDGMNWTRRFAGIGNHFLGVFHFGGGFLLTAEDDLVLVSSDGQAWAGLNFHNEITAREVIHAGGQYAVIGETTFVDFSNRRHFVATSPDGIVWTHRRQTSFQSEPVRGVAHDGNKFLAVAGSGNGYSGAFWAFDSSDGIHWNSAVTLLDFVYGAPEKLIHDGTQFVMLSHSSIISELATYYTAWVTVSVDGVTWTRHERIPWTGLGGRYFDIVHAGQRYILLGEGGKITSLSLVDDSHGYYVAGKTPRGVTHGAGMFVAVGDDGAVYTSFDSLDWTARDSGTDRQLLDVAYDGSRFVAVGAAGVILSSADAITWTLEASPTSLALRKVIFGGGRLLAAGDSILRSIPDPDADGDGVEDIRDRCMFGATGWTSNSGTDNDGDGCRDSDEDSDDDNDGIPDSVDRKSLIPATVFADLNGDDGVDSLDLAVMMSYWGDGAGWVDLDSDGAVAVADLRLLRNAMEP